MSKEKVKSYYVDNEKFLEALKEHRVKYLEAKANGTDIPTPSNYIGECIMKIAQNYSYKHRFIGYSYRDELVLDAIEVCIKYLNTFDPEKGSNPFSYFTTTCHREFHRTLKKEGKQKLIKDKIISESPFEEFSIQDHDMGEDFHNTYADFQRENLLHYEYGDRHPDE